jgi:shikimate kinase
MKIYLLGMPGCGKSTIGKMLATSLGLTFIDMDEEIEKETGKSVQEIFDSDGESNFRFLERQLLQMLAGQDSIVVATGGGVPIHNNNMEMINSTGISIYLKASIGQLESRLKEDLIRPLLRKENLKDSLAQLLTEREDIYSQSNYTIRVSEDPRITVQGIVEILEIKPRGY